MDPNSLSKKMNYKNKSFLGALGGKDMMPPSWALGGAMAGLPRPPPPGSASGYHYISLVLDLAFGDRESKNPHNVFRDILVSYLNHVVLRATILLSLARKNSCGKKLPSSGASFPPSQLNDSEFSLIKQIRNRQQT